MSERRLGGLLAAAVVLLGALGLRLTFLQSFQGEALSDQARHNATRDILLPAPRGRLFARGGQLLVGNKARFNVAYLTEGGADTELREALAEALGLDAKALSDRLEQSQTPPTESLDLGVHLGRTELARLAAVQTRYPGLMIEARAERTYRYAKSASHLLGHLGRADPDAVESGADPSAWVGKDGVEHAYERQLRGRPGVRVLLVDAAGRPLKVESEQSPEAGQDLLLTIDLELQRRAEQALEKAVLARKSQRAAGAVVALECETGKIRALASWPDYQPAWFSQGASRKKFDSLFQDPRAPLFNRAVNGAYPAASTFKWLVSIAAFRAELVGEQSGYYCPGYEMVGDLRFNCFVRSGHGYLSFEEALAHSCDVVYYRLGTALGVDKIAAEASAFGFGRQTGISLPGEASGHLPSSTWKLSELGQPWYAGDDANLAIGQGFLTVTPLQMAAACGALVNGGMLYRPALVEAVGHPDDWKSVSSSLVGKIELPERGLQRVLQGMAGAVDYGTATRAYDTALAISGKTGTVENAKTIDNPEGSNHTWFVSFSPRDKPKLVVVVFLEQSGGYGGGTAAPVARELHRVWAGLSPE